MVKVGTGARCGAGGPLSESSKEKGGRGEGVQLNFQHRTLRSHTCHSIRLPFLLPLLRSCCFHSQQPARLLGQVHSLNFLPRRKRLTEQIAMGKGPGFYSDIGKKTKDLLNKDYTYDQKFVITTNTQSGLAFTSTGVKRGEGFSGDVNTSFVNRNITADVKVDTKSNIFATVIVDEFAPGAKSVFTFTIPDHKSGKLELLYKQDFCGISGAIGLTPTPIVEATGALGSEGFSVGGELAFDTASGSLIKYNAGLGFVKPDFNASLILAEKGDLLKASYLHTVSPVSRTTVAAEIAHRFSKNENTFTVGGLYELDTLTTVKARLNNHGKLAALLQHEWRPKSLITFSGEVDTKSLDKTAKIGLALALKP